MSGRGGQPASPKGQKKGVDSMKKKTIALLIPWWVPGTDTKGWNWETPNEKTISTHASREDAIANKPDGYRHLDDGWNAI
jgi:hypothetical protein